MDLEPMAGESSSGEVPSQGGGMTAMKEPYVSDTSLALPSDAGVKESVRMGSEPTLTSAADKSITLVIEDGGSSASGNEGFKRANGDFPFPETSKLQNPNVLQPLVENQQTPIKTLVGPSPCITASDYGDRQRLLYHITYLSTQLQRAQLQLQEQQQTLTILQGAVAAHASPQSEEGNGAILHIHPSCATAAVLAARGEQGLTEALIAALGKFDPLLAQTQIHRLDSALAQLSILREAELQQLQRAEKEVEQLRGERSLLVQKVDHLQSHCENLERVNAEQSSTMAASEVEVERLRQEERRLIRHIALLESLERDGGVNDGVRVVVASPRTTYRSESCSPHAQVPGSAVEKLVIQEMHARQELLQDLFWDPMLLAWDAALTWVAEVEDMQRERAYLPHGAETVTTERAMGLKGPSLDSPPTDADLLLLRHQHKEIGKLHGSYQLLREQVRIAHVENDRLRALYEAEQRRSEGLAKDHKRQLELAYDELLRERQHIMHSLQREVGEQVRMAFRDGQLLQQRKHREQVEQSKGRERLGGKRAPVSSPRPRRGESCPGQPAHMPRGSHS